MALVKEGPDVALFTNPGALMKLALWVGEAVKEVDKDDGKSKKKSKGGMPLVLGCIHEAKGVYVVVGLGGGGDAVGKSKEAREEREKKRKEQEQQKAQKKEEKQAAKRQARANRGEPEEDDEEEIETEDESEASSGSEASDDESDNEETSKRALSRNRFGNAFQEVVEETSARVRLDSFEHCVVEVKKDDLSGFLESLSMKAVVG